MSLKPTTCLYVRPYVRKGLSLSPCFQQGFLYLAALYTVVSSIVRESKPACWDGGIYLDAWSRWLVALKVLRSVVAFWHAWTASSCLQHSMSDQANIT